MGLFSYPQRMGGMWRMRRGEEFKGRYVERVESGEWGEKLEVC